MKRLNLDVDEGRRFLESLRSHSDRLTILNACNAHPNPYGHRAWEGRRISIEHRTRQEALLTKDAIDFQWACCRARSLMNGKDGMHAEDEDDNGSVGNDTGREDANDCLADMA
jgi:hypothetical protein